MQDTKIHAGESKAAKQITAAGRKPSPLSPSDSHLIPIGETECPSMQFVDSFWASCSFIFSFDLSLFKRFPDRLLLLLLPKSKCKKKRKSWNKARSIACRTSNIYAKMLQTNFSSSFQSALSFISRRSVHFQFSPSRFSFFSFLFPLNVEDICSSNSRNQRLIYGWNSNFHTNFDNYNSMESHLIHKSKKKKKRKYWLTEFSVSINLIALNRLHSDWSILDFRLPKVIYSRIQFDSNRKCVFAFLFASQIHWHIKHVTPSIQYFRT